MIVGINGKESGRCLVPAVRASRRWTRRPEPRWSTSPAVRPCQPGWRAARASSCRRRRDARCAILAPRSAATATWSAIGWIASARGGSSACTIFLARAVSRLSPPVVEAHLVRLACDLPERHGRSLSQWDCAELAAQVQREGLVPTISAETVRRRLARHRLKPWRSHYWLHPKAPRDAAFVAQTQAVADLLTRPLAPDEVVLSLDEMTSLQPRPRHVATRPAQPGRPLQVEHEYRRAGAVHLFAAFDTRQGQAYGRCFRRKRQVEYLAFLEELDGTFPATTTRIHLLGDNVSVHHGQAVRAWLAQHPRFVTHFTPVHCSWMNPVEQWFSILRRKRLRHPNFADVAALEAQIAQFITEWNATAHPFRWQSTSFANILAQAEATLATAADSWPSAA